MSNELLLTSGPYIPVKPHKGINWEGGKNFFAEIQNLNICINKINAQILKVKFLSGGKNYSAIRTASVRSHLQHAQCSNMNLNALYRVHKMTVKKRDTVVENLLG